MNNILSIIKMRLSLFSLLLALVVGCAYITGVSIKSQLLAAHRKELKHHALDIVADCELLNEKVKEGHITMQDAVKEILMNVKYVWYMHDHSSDYFAYIGTFDKQGNIRTTFHSIGQIKRGLVSANMKTIFSEEEMGNKGSIRDRRGIPIDYHGDDAGGVRGKGKRIGHAFVYEPWNWIVVISSSENVVGSVVRAKLFYVYLFFASLYFLICYTVVFIDSKWNGVLTKSNSDLEDYKNVFENSINYLAVMNEDGVLTKVSKSIKEHAVDEEDITRKLPWKTMWWGYSASSIKRFKRAFEIALSEGEADETFSHPASFSNSVHVHYKFHRIEKGDQISITVEGVASEEEELLGDEYKYNEEVYEFFFENSADPQFVLSSQRGVVAVNLSALSFFGIKNKSEMLGISLLELSSRTQPGEDDISIAINDIQSLAMANGTHTVEWVFVDSHKFERVAKLNLTRGIIRDELVLFATCVDTSEEKNRENEDKFYTCQLEELVVDKSKKLKHRDDEITKLNLELEGSYKKQDQFKKSASISEDLVTSSLDIKELASNADETLRTIIKDNVSSELKLIAEDLDKIKKTSASMLDQARIDTSSQHTDLLQIVKDTFYIAAEKLKETQFIKELDVSFSSDISFATYPLSVRNIFYSIFCDSLGHLQQNVKKPSILISLQSASPYLVIQISDNRKQMLEDKVDSYVTGIKSTLLCNERPIRQVVQEYGGDIAVNYTDGRFMYEVLLPEEDGLDKKYLQD